MVERITRRPGHKRGQGSRAQTEKPPTKDAAPQKKRGGEDRSGPKRATANAGRVAATRALIEVEEGKHLEDVLPGMLPEDGRDRGLAWFLAFGVLRCRGQVDAALRPLLKQPLADLDPGVRATLRIGAFEALFGRAKAHATVSQAVEVARAVGVGRASGLVNAVLRKLPDEAPAHKNHPSWLSTRWLQRYGDEGDAWLANNAEPPPIFVVAPKGLPEGLEGEPVVLRGAHLAHTFRVEVSGPVTDLPGFDTGAFWVQDAAAVRVADLLGDVLPAGAAVLDACAAPGGKAFRLASRGFAVHGVDRNADRLRMVRDGAERLGFQLTVRPHDWLRGPISSQAPVAGVLVDAPCSGLGTIRRHPEIRWRRQPTELESAGERQLAILTAASTHVAPGGWLVYAVCSPEPEEGDNVVKAFLEAHPDFSIDTTLVTAPPEQGEDAHAAFRMRRRG